MLLVFVVLRTTLPYLISSVLVTKSRVGCDSRPLGITVNVSEHCGPWMPVISDGRWDKSRRCCNIHRLVPPWFSSLWKSLWHTTDESTAMNNITTLKESSAQRCRSESLKKHKTQIAVREHQYATAPPTPSRSSATAHSVSILCIKPAMAPRPPPALLMLLMWWEGVNAHQHPTCNLTFPST